MLILLINVVFVALLTTATLYLVSGILKYWRSLAQMQSMYVVSQNMDANQRSAMQYDHLATSWLGLGVDAAKQIAWSIGCIGVIIALRITAGVMIHAYL